MKFFIAIASFCSAITAGAQTLPLLQVSANHRYFQTADGKPFFWLGDTGWLLFSKCSREEAVQYLETRKQQGFNVVQAMVLHSLSAVNVYGDSALIQHDIARPQTGNASADSYWNHIDFVLQEAAKRGIYIGMVPLWGSNIKDGRINAEQTKTYAAFLSDRFKKYSNIIWINGGDIKGGDAPEVWNALGSTIKQHDQAHLVTFHPRGRNSSSEWFQNQTWLDFNMFQSGHKDYTQDTSSNETNHYGEDNWKFVDADYQRQPLKPVLDGEPSYENIPHGLHDSLQPRWKAADVRRYAYWSVFAGSAGFTYGENAVMQFHTLKGKSGSFGVNESWKETIHAAGAEQMKYLKQLMLSKSFFDREPAQQILTGNNGNRYDHLLATQGNRYAMVYTFTGKPFTIDFQQLHFRPSKAGWYSPVNGRLSSITGFKKTGKVSFQPPGPSPNSDWVLVLE